MLFENVVCASAPARVVVVAADVAAAAPPHQTKHSPRRTAHAARTAMHHQAMPIIVNVTVLNSMGVAGYITEGGPVWKPESATATRTEDGKTPTYTGETPKPEDLLSVKFRWSTVVW